MSSDEEDERRTEEPTEAELALKKRREAQKPAESRGGLDEAAKELLQSNREERQRMDDEISELRQRNERRKKEREIEEKRLAAERNAEEERRKTVEEDKRRKKEEEEEKKKKDRAQKTAEFDKMKNPGNKPNFVISKRAEEGSEEPEEEKAGVPRKSKEQTEAEKKAILAQRIQPLKIDGLDAAKLAEAAKEFHKAILRLESEKYDHEKRFKAQQVDMMELAERARQANKVGRGGLKRVQVGQDDVDDVQARFSGAPAKIEMYSKYERQTDKRQYNEKKCVYGGPTWATPIEKIRPTKIVKWSEEGLPQYEEKGEGEHGEPPAEEVAA